MGVKIATSILMLIAGIGVFLIACRILSRNIEAASGSRLKNLFSKTSKSKFIGAGLGTITAVAIQSSGAVTVMAIGFLNAGLMTLAQASTVVFGANIGTTITGQIVALGMFGGETISTSVIFTAFAGVGAFMMLFAKKNKVQVAGSIIAGFGLLFVGLDIMSSSMTSFAEMESLKLFIASISNPLLLVFLGVALTAILQSASVMTSILITMVFSGLISMDQGVYMVIGASTGACVTGLLAAIGSTTDAKRLAVIHVVYNVLGAIIFLVLGLILDAVSHGSASYSAILAKMFPGAPHTQLAMFNTLYNIIKLFLLIGLTTPLVKLFQKIIKDKKPQEDEGAPKVIYIEEHFLKTPPIAVGMVKKEVERMANIAIENFNISMDTVCTLNFISEAEFKHNEDTLNFLNRAITKYIVTIPRDQISDTDNIYISTVYHTVSDLERIGDYAENIVEYAERLKSIEKTFSNDAINEVRFLQDMINTLYSKVDILYTQGDMSKLQEAYDIEDEIDDVTEQMEERHVERLNAGVCSPEVGAPYLELTSNAERIADHWINVAKCTRKFNKGTHPIAQKS